MRETTHASIEEKIRFGKYYGYGTIFTISIILPLAMILSPEYEQVDQISDLGATKESALVFNIGSILIGICLFQYFTLYLKNKADPSYDQLWKLIIGFGQIAGIGSIGVGLIPYQDNWKELHQWLAVLLFAGMTISIFLLSIYLYSIDSQRVLAVFGIIIFIYSIMYPLYFRMRPSKGYWQKGYLFSIVIWHILLNTNKLEPQIKK